MLKNAQIGQPVHSQPVVSTGSVIGQVSSVLAVIVLLILACGWLAKRLGFAPKTVNTQALKISASVQVGRQERVVIVDTADARLVLGVTAPHRSPANGADDRDPGNPSVRLTGHRVNQPVSTEAYRAVLSLDSLPSLAAAKQSIIAVGRAFDARGWAPATAGNYSIRLNDGDFAITASGCHKGRLKENDVIVVDDAGRSAEGRTPSAETELHLALYRRFENVGAVLHSHSPVAVALTRAMRDAEDWEIEGHELLKVFPGVSSHRTRITIPIVENSQDMADIKRAIAPRLLATPAPPAYLIRDHGLYGWGRTIEEAERVIEAVEWLVAAELAERSFKAGRTV